MKTPRFVLSALFAVIAVTLHATIGIGLQMPLGNPSGATTDTSNHSHYLISRAQYAMDYNDTTHQANWVAWSYTTNDSGGSGRSDDFFVDTSLPAGFYQVLTTDYSGSGYDRGHMCPSADRTISRADNDVTFFMSNMVPQTPDNNRGVWANFETYSRSLAAAGNEILIMAGTSGFSGSALASGVAIPGYTWKIIVVVPLGAGTAVDRIVAAGASAIRVIAVKMPNIAGINSTPWENFVTSPAQIQSDTGLTFFTDLPAPIAADFRGRIDGHTSAGAPAIVVQPVPQSAPVGGNATFTVSASGNNPLSYQWFHGDDDITGATSDTLSLTNVQAADVGSYYVVVTNDVGATTSSSVALVVTGLPTSITTQPATRDNIAAGSTVSFTVVAGGSGPFTYEWHKTSGALGANASGAATPTLTLTNVQAADAGSYYVTVSNAALSTATSNPAGLTVLAAAPTITSQPANRSLAPGSNATFSVVATGTAPLSYQWFKGTPATPVSIAANPSAGTDTLVLTGITLGDAGSYGVVVSNGVGTPATSTLASLTISSASTTQIFYTGGTLVQDFNTLPSSGTFANNSGGSATAVVPLSAAPINASGLGGWTLAQTLTSGGTQRFTVGTGSGNTGSVYSFGASANSERSLGLLSSSSNVSVIGAVIVNNTGQTINTATLGYAGEQWRWGGSTGDKLMVEYRVGGTDIVTGPFTAVPALDFASPVQSGGAAGALDGNTNRSTKSTVLTGLAWGPGQSLVIRWRQFRTTSADGLGIDDFSFSTAITGATGPSVASTNPGNGATDLPLNTAIAVTFDQGVNAPGSAFTINSASRGVIAATLSVSADKKTYTFTPPTNFDFSDTVSVGVSAAGVTSVSTGLHPAADYSFSFTTAAPVPVSITAHPAAQLNIPAGGTATFSVSAAGTAPFTYQWRKGGMAVSGNPTAATATLVLANVQAGDMGSYDVVVGNSVGSPVTSNSAALTITPSAPVITTQPVAQTVAVGDTVTLTVAAKGTTPFTYQWRKGTTTVGTGQTLTIANAQVTDSGSYSVIVSNGVGTPATSNAVSVLVVAPPSVLNFSGGTYAQNFDTLPSTGTFTFTGPGPFSLDANPGVNASGLAGWSFGKNNGSGANALFRFDTGSSNSGSTMSYGIAGTNPLSDRALGSLASGTMASRFGVTLVNTSGHTINFVTISYTGEQWRHGGAVPPNKLTFSYAVGTPDISTGTFTNAPALDFTAPIATTTSALVLDGNFSANRIPNITSTLTGLNWAPGQTLVLRWTDVDDGGADDGLAIDDFTLTDAPPVPVITTQPADLTVPAFSPASFSVAATSQTPLSYAWQKNGAPIMDNPSALTATLLIPSATAADAGAYSCVVTNSFGSTSSAPAVLTTTKVSAGLVLDSLLTTFDGAPKAATAVTAPAGLNVTISYDGAPLPPVNAGSYTVVATIEDENYEGSALGTLVIAKATAIVTLGDLEQIYSGSPLAASGQTNPPGLLVSLSYDGAPLAPTNAGSYAVVGTVVDPNYEGSASGTLVIAKAAATVTLADLSQVYTGAPRVASATTNPTGLAVSFSYDGAPAAPVNAGSYAVVATVNDANYEGSAGGTLVVGKAAAIVTLGDLAAVYDGSPKAASATTNPAGLNVTFTYDGAPGAPTNAGSYAVVATIDDANYAGGATGTLAIAKATAAVTLGNLVAIYDGTPKAATATTTPTGLTVTLTYGGSAAAPIDAGSYAVVATIDDANHAGSASGTLVIAKATAPVTLNNLAQVYDGTPRIVTPAVTPAGLTVNLTYNGSAAAPTNAGSYAISAAVNDVNYEGSATGTLVVAKATATITLGDLFAAYDGNPHAVNVTTDPAGLSFTVTYDSGAAVPTNPGSYAVLVTINDANYQGTASATLQIDIAALVRHLGALSGGIHGSIQVTTGEATTLNGNSWISGNLLVPGTPDVRQNGHPTYSGTTDGTGATTPTGYTVTLNGNSTLQHVVRRTNALTLPVVSAPPAPTGTRNVVLNTAGQSAGDFATLRNLTLNSNAGSVSVPAGTYGTLTANGSSILVLGEAGATTASVYNLQGLVLGGNAQVRVIGPVIVNLASGLTLNGNMGDAGHPEWLELNLASGGLTLNGNVVFDGYVTAPNGTVTINGGTVLSGGVVADRLTVNGNGALLQP